MSAGAVGEGTSRRSAAEGGGLHGPARSGQVRSRGARSESASGWWLWSPAYTLGLIAFFPALDAALTLRRRNLWAWAVGLVVGNLVSWVLMYAGPNGPDGTNTPAQDAGALLALLLAVLGTVHAFRVRHELFAPRRPASSAGVGPTGLDPVVARAMAARERRAKSAALSAADPGLARDLRIGRPDLAREYDDGGLVDVNHVPEAVLVSHLGLTPGQARTVVDARDRLGGFHSDAELSALADVPPRTLEAIQDRIVTL